MTIAQEVIRLLVAAGLGSSLGLERERLDRGAGLRTHALVATASALVFIVSAYGFSDVLVSGRVVLDPSRVAAQVVSGIGFLGAGTIILRKNAVRGLTTAASIWAVAAIGLASGAGLFAPAVATTVILLAILLGLKPVERRLFSHKRVWLFTIRARRQPGQMTAIEASARACSLVVWRLHLEPGRAESDTTIRLELRGGTSESLFSLAERLQQVPGVTSVSYGGRALTARELEADEPDDELAHE